MSSVKLCALIAMLSLATLANGRALLQSTDAVKTPPHKAVKVDGVRTGGQNSTNVGSGNYKFDYTLNQLKTGDHHIFANNPSIDISSGCGAGTWVVCVMVDWMVDIGKGVTDAMESAYTTMHCCYTLPPQRTKSATASRFVDVGKVLRQSYVKWCHQQVVDPCAPHLSVFRMHGEGTDGTATGVVFTCHMTISFFNAITNQSTPGCDCSFQVSNPYSSSNSWSVDCPCLTGFQYSIPSVRC